MQTAPEQLRFCAPSRTRTDTVRILRTGEPLPATRRNGSPKRSYRLQGSVFERCRYAFGTGSDRPRVARGRRGDAGVSRGGVC
jgi:hypothetical protein